MKSLRLLLLAVLLLPFAAHAMPVQALSIQTSAGKMLTFKVEVATTQAEQEHGLMDRSSMPEDHGMLFDFGSVQPIDMWMKNTLIPLDMLFMDAKGKILGIAARTVPMSEAIIASPGPVLAVLELNGGTAERLGIKAGDLVIHPIFKRDGG